jgi:hypothetical protein
VHGRVLTWLCLCCGVQVLGAIPPSMASRADKGAAKFFTGGQQQLRLAWPDSHTSNKSKGAVK